MSLVVAAEYLVDRSPYVIEI